MKAREAGFDANFHTSRLPEYNGLFDKSLRHHFENRSTQRLLHRMGLVSRPHPHRREGALHVCDVSAINAHPLTFAHTRTLSRPTHTYIHTCVCTSTSTHAVRERARVCPLQIDTQGHVIDLSRNASKLSIIEQEFRAAEKAEQDRLKEEEEMRVSVPDTCARACVCVCMCERNRISTSVCACMCTCEGARTYVSVRARVRVCLVSFWALSLTLPPTTTFCSGVCSASVTRRWSVSVTQSASSGCGQTGASGGRS